MVKFHTFYLKLLFIKYVTGICPSKSYLKGEWIAWLELSYKVNVSSKGVVGKRGAGGGGGSFPTSNHIPDTQKILDFLNPYVVST